MANKRISELPVAGKIIGAELLPVMQSGETRKTTINSVLADIESRKVGFVDLDSGALSPSFNTIKLSSNPTLGTISVGEFYYDVAEQTATLNLGTTNLQVGQELYVRVRNNTGSAIPNGSVVYINGASGTRPTVALARANSINTATTVIGVTTEEIASGALGSVTISGIVNELNTSAYAEGTLLYLSSSTAGAFVQTAPNYPNLLIEVGRVVRQHATQGQILVKVAVNNASYLKGELGNSETAVVGSGLVGYNSSRAYSAGTVGAELNNHGSVITTLTNGIATKIGKTASTGSAEIPVGTTVQRDGAAQQGYFRFNSTLNQFEGYNGTAWGAIAFDTGVQLSFRNKIINGAFGFNQRAYVSGAATSAGQYTLDRWKVTGTGGITFSTTNNKTTVTIPAGQTLQQVIEGLNLATGTYVLSWEGTAQGRIGAGSYGASGTVTASITGGANTTIEFNAGTVANVQLEAGSVATPFEHRPYGLELSLCQRYFCLFNCAASGAYPTTSGAIARSTFDFPVTMRATPTITAGTAAGFSNISYDSFFSVTPNVFGGTYEVNKGADAGNFYGIRYANSASAEL